MSSQATDQEQQTTPRDQTITKGVEKVTPSRFLTPLGKVVKGKQGLRVLGKQPSVKAPTTEDAKEKADLLKALEKGRTSPQVFFPPRKGGTKSKRKKKHRRRTSKRGGHCGKSINKINRLLKALKKEMKILERKQKSYYTKSKKVKKNANKRHIKTFKKLKLQLNKI